MTSSRKEAARCSVLSSKYKPISKSFEGQKGESTAFMLCASSVYASSCFNKAFQT